MSSEETEFQQSSATMLKEMVTLLGLKAEVKAEQDQEKLVLHLSAGEPGRLIGRKGRALENLEYLLNRIMAKKYGKTEPVVIDVDGYRRKKREGKDKEKEGKRNGGSAPKNVPEEEEEKLKKMALDMAKEVKRWGEAKEIGPYASEKRKIIHTALRDVPEVITESSSEENGGAEKNIVIRVAEAYE